MEWSQWLKAAVKQVKIEGSTIINPPDHQGRNDIACRDHGDLWTAAKELTIALKSEGVTVVIEVVTANGFPCALDVHVAAGNNLVRDCLCQHSGSWGPWYHISRYRRNKKTGRWCFAEKIGGHYSRARANRLGLPFGRPTT